MYWSGYRLTSAETARPNMLNQSNTNNSREGVDSQLQKYGLRVHFRISLKLWFTNGITWYILLVHGQTLHDLSLCTQQTGLTSLFTCLWRYDTLRTEWLLKAWYITWYRRPGGGDHVGHGQKRSVGRSSRSARGHQFHGYRYQSCNSEDGTCALCHQWSGANKDS